MKDIKSIIKFLKRATSIEIGGIIAYINAFADNSDIHFLTIKLLKDIILTKPRQGYNIITKANIKAFKLLLNAVNYVNDIINEYYK